MSKLHGYSGQDIKTVTLRGTLATVRAFLRFCGTIDAVEEELWDKLPLPVAGPSGQVSDSTLDPDHAKAILEYLDRLVPRPREQSERGTARRTE